MSTLISILSLRWLEGHPIRDVNVEEDGVEFGLELLDEGELLGELPVEPPPEVQTIPGEGAGGSVSQFRRSLE